MAGAILDVRGLNCPIPVLKLKKAIKQAPEGGILEVLATDPGAAADFEAFCRATGNELLEQNRGGDGVYRFLIKHIRR